MIKPKVAIVHDSLHSIGGAERVTAVISEVYPEAPIYTLLYKIENDFVFQGKQIITSYLQKLKWLPSKALFPLMPQAIESFDLSDFDIVISSSNSFAKNIITKPSTLHISYLHSPMRFVWDSWHTYLSSQRANALTKNLAASLLHRIRIWDKLGASRVDVFLANSYNVQKRIAKYYRREAIVLHPPVDTDKIVPESQNQGYFLVVSRLSGYKQIALAVQACTELDLPLKIIGTGEEMENLRKLAGPKVELLGWVSDQDKFEYLRNARALIFPGEEDFGIVPVEAMAAGKPVIAYKIGGLLETVIDGETGVFFEKATVFSLKQAIQKFLAFEHTFDYLTISQHASQFSAERFRHELKTIVDTEYVKFQTANHE